MHSHRSPNLPMIFTRSLAQTFGAYRLKIGERVVVNGKSGVLKYIGYVEFATGMFGGVALDKQLGKHDGSKDGKRYFKAEPGYGVFAPIHRIDRDPQSVIDNRALSRSRDPRRASAPRSQVFTGSGDYTPSSDESLPSIEHCKSAKTQKPIDQMTCNCGKAEELGQAIDFIKRLQDQLETKENEFDQIQHNQKSAEARLLQEKRSSRALQEELEELMRLHSQKLNDAADESNSIDRLQDMQDELMMKKEQLQKDYKEQLKSEHSDLQEMCDKLCNVRDDLDALKVAYDKLQKDSQETENLLLDEKATCAALRAEVESLTDTIAVARETMTQLSSQLENQNAELCSVREQLELADSNAGVDDLKTELFVKNEEIGTLHVRLKELEENNAAALLEKDSQFAALREQTDEAMLELQRKHGATVQECSNLTVEVTAIRFDLESERRLSEQREIEFAERLAEKDREIVEESRRSEELKERLAELEDAAEEVAELRAESEAAVQTLQSSDVAHIQNECTQLQSKLSELTNQLDKINTKHAEQNALLQQKTSEITALTAENEQKGDALQFLAVEVERVQRALYEAEQRAEIMETENGARIKDMMAFVEEAKLELDEKNKELANSFSDRRKSTANLEEATHKIGLLTFQLREARTELDARRDSIAELEVKLRKNSEDSAVELEDYKKPILKRSETTLH